jgi:hypothetical protein
VSELHVGLAADRPNRPQTKLISDPQELYRFLAAADIEVCSIHFASENIVWIAWRYADEVSLTYHTQMMPLAALLRLVY